MNKQQADFKETIILYTYRYIFKTKDNKVCIKYLTDVQEAHKTLQTQIRDNPNIVSCVREYVNEINFEYVGYTESVKEEKKEKGDENDEKKS